MSKNKKRIKKLGLTEEEALVIYEALKDYNKLSRNSNYVLANRNMVERLLTFYHEHRGDYL